MEKIYIKPEATIYGCSPIDTFLQDSKIDVIDPETGEIDEGDALSKGGMWEYMED